MSRALFFIILYVIVIAKAVDICDSACGCLEYERDYLIVNCKDYKNHHPDIDLELIEWPKIQNRTIKFFFNNMSLHLLPK